VNAYRDGDTIIAPRRAEGPDALGDAWIALEPGTSEYEMWDEWLLSIEETQEVTAAAGADVTPGHDELHHWWTRGKGKALWAESDEPWTTLVAQLMEHVEGLTLPTAKKWASKWYIEVFGFSAGSDKARVAHGKPPRGKVVGPG